MSQENIRTCTASVETRRTATKEKNQGSVALTDVGPLVFPWKSFCVARRKGITVSIRYLQVFTLLWDLQKQNVDVETC
jgi:hypothetical protein